MRARLTGKSGNLMNVQAGSTMRDVPSHRTGRRWIDGCHRVSFRFHAVFDDTDSVFVLVNSMAPTTLTWTVGPSTSLGLDAHLRRGLFVPMGDGLDYEFDLGLAPSPRMPSKDVLNPA